MRGYDDGDNDDTTNIVNFVLVSATYFDIGGLRKETFGWR